ncbi:hypothetical protein D9M69_431910 [compost metagenome]
MKLENTISFANVLIWIGALVFAFFMSLLVRNQTNTLVALKLEMDSQWHLVQSKHRKVADKFKDAYEALGWRYIQQRVMISVVSVVVSASVIATTAMLLYASGLIEGWRCVLYFGCWGGLAYVLVCWLWDVVFKKYAREYVGRAMGHSGEDSD